MPGRFVNIPACSLPVSFNHGTEPALSHSWNKETVHGHVSRLVCLPFHWYLSTCIHELTCSQNILVRQKRKKCTVSGTCWSLCQEVCGEVTVHWNRLTREAVESSPLEILKNYLDTILCCVL
ncbi:uncharacterized protein M8220_001156 [Acridotheres tristis]